MRYNQLGATSLTVSEIGFGCFAIGGDRSGNSYGPTDDAVSMAAIEVALDHGCTFFDTADVYGFGHSEEVLGEALRRSRNGSEAVVATKVGARFDGGQVRHDYSAPYLRAAVEASLQRLQRDVIDLCQLHDPPLAVLQAGEALDCLERLREEGKIRACGVSIHSFDEAQQAARGGRALAVQAALNVFCLVEPDDRVPRLLQLVEDTGIGLIAREPLASGFLSGGHEVETTYAERDLRGGWSPARKNLYVALAEAFVGDLRPDVEPAQAAIRFVLDQPQVSTTIVGTKTPAQARANFSACELPPYSELTGGGVAVAAERF